MKQKNQENIQLQGNVNRFHLNEMVVITILTILNLSAKVCNLLFELGSADFTYKTAFVRQIKKKRLILSYPQHVKNWKANPKSKIASLELCLLKGEREGKTVFSLIYEMGRKTFLFFFVFKRQTANSKIKLFQIIFSCLLYFWKWVYCIVVLSIAG